MPNDKVALTTGGGAGIGKAIGPQMAKNRAKSRHRFPSPFTPGVPIKSFLEAVKSRSWIITSRRTKLKASGQALNICGC